MKTGHQLLTYSPLPPEAYTRPCSEAGRVGIGLELSSPERRAKWNLYWLSDPALDDFVSGAVARGIGRVIDSEMLRACMRATEQRAGGQKVGSLLLRLMPRDFVRFLQQHGYRRLAPYILRGDAWFNTISERAGLFRGLLSARGNVRHVNFAGKVSNQKVETGSPVSATIMTLEYRKT